MGENDIHIHYFGGRGRGEAIRILLEDTALPYQFHVVNDWPGTKKTDRNFSPFGQLPVLHHQGFALGQSNSILRYIGAVAQRNGKNHQEQALMDMILDSAEDLRMGYVRIIYGGDYNGQVGGFVSKLPDTLRYFETFLEQHNVEYFGLEHFSYPDASLFTVIDNIKIKMSPDCLEQFPRLKAWYHRVIERPNIAHYLSSEMRPIKVNGNDLV